MDNYTKMSNTPGKEQKECNCGFDTHCMYCEADTKGKVLTDGKYIITRYHDKDYGLEQEDGEGMKVAIHRLSKPPGLLDLVNVFYREHF